MSLLDRWMPEHDVAAQYDITIHAPTSQVYTALMATEFGRLPLVWLLMFLRSIPGLLFSPRETIRRFRASRREPSLRLKSVLKDDFVLLEEAPGSEIVIGLTGRFWNPAGGLLRTDPATFRTLPPPGNARAAWNFEVIPTSPTESLLSTETRVRCSDPETTRRFKRYWTLVSPGSGIIRWAILRQVRRNAERAVAS